ncbi:MAG TPA: hypothetical protein VJ768_04290 [Anaerolineales bacterium]|nr:hypothetical protein [Anaerolineales bacterium]
MLKDIKELLQEDEDDLYPGEVDHSRRRYYILGGVAGGLLLLALVCLGAYAIFLSPGGAEGNGTATSQSQTQMVLAAGLTTATDPPPTATPTEMPLTDTPVPSATSEPSPTPTETLPPTEVEATPTVTSSPPPTTTPIILFQENFEGSGGAWPTAVTENYTYGIVAGEFKVEFFTSFVEIWSIRARDYDDLRTEADISFSADSTDGYAGLMCRFQDGFNFYGGLLNGQGDYAIVRRSGTSLIELAGLENAGVIENPQEANRIRLDCVGSNLTLFVNGTRVLETVDDSYDGGRVGVFAGTLETPALEAAIDDYIIAAP